MISMENSKYTYCTGTRWTATSTIMITTRVVQTLWRKIQMDTDKVTEMQLPLWRWYWKLLRSGVALDILQAPMAGHIWVDNNPQAQRVVEANFPGSILVGDVESMDEAWWGYMVVEWSLKFGMVGLVVLGAGPPRSGGFGLKCRQVWSS